MAKKYNEIVDRLVSELGSEWSKFKLGPDAFWPDSSQRIRGGQRVTNINVDAAMFTVQINSLLSRMWGSMPPEDAKRMGFPTD
jgi:hypothetical protein